MILYDLFDLFYDGSETGSDAEMKWDDFTVSYDSVSDCSRFRFMGISIASYDLHRRILYIKPISCRLVYDHDFSDAYDDYITCIKFLQRIIHQGKFKGLI